MSSEIEVLRQDGIVLLPDLLTGEQLEGMQSAFDVRLKRMRWNDFDGFEKTEPYRHMVQDILTLDQGFVDVALNPLVKSILSEYIGPQYQLCEAKGWKSRPTKKDFHGWHGDAWYDQQHVSEISKEVKLGVYLTDVKTGSFNYIKGSHRKQHPRSVDMAEVEEIPQSEIVEVKGKAGSAFLFDTSGIHRQGVPMLEPRQAVFFNYHNVRQPGGDPCRHAGSIHKRLRANTDPSGNPRVLHQ